MKLRVNVKSLGKRKKAVEETVCEIHGCPGTVRELIEAVVDAQVEEYNKRLEAAWMPGGEEGPKREGDGREKLPGVLACLTREEIEEKAQGGRIGFGVNHGEKKADKESAKANAIQCFEDGIYRIFMDGQPLEELDHPVVVTEENVFTFVRLTMLAGRMW